MFDPSFKTHFKDLLSKVSIFLKVSLFDALDRSKHTCKKHSYCYKATRNSERPSNELCRKLMYRES